MSWWTTHRRQVFGSLIGANVGEGAGGIIGGRVAPGVLDKFGSTAGGQVGLGAGGYLPPEQRSAATRRREGAGSTFSFKSDASVQSNIERAMIVARGYGGVTIKQSGGPGPVAADNLQAGHFFPTAPAEPTGGLHAALERRRALRLIGGGI